MDTQRPASADIADLCVELMAARRDRDPNLSAVCLRLAAGHRDLGMHVAVTLAGVTCEPVRRVIDREWGPGPVTVSLMALDGDGTPVDDIETVPAKMRTATRMVAAAVQRDWTLAQDHYRAYAATHTPAQTAELIGYLLSAACHE